MVGPAPGRSQQPGLIYLGSASRHPGLPWPDPIQMAFGVALALGVSFGQLGAPERVCVCVRRAHGACESTHGVKVSAEIRFLEM